MLRPSFMSATPTHSHDTTVDQPPDRRTWQEQHGPRLYSLGRALPKNTIRFKCLDCGRPMEARAQDGGVDTNCPHCAAPLTVPRIPPNPYLRPITKHRPPNERGAISIPLFATADPTRSINIGPRSLCRSIYHHRRRYPSCWNFPRTHPRYAETFARRIDRGTQRTGDQHRNLLAPFPSLLDDSAAVRTDWFILEFASSQRPSHDRAATLHRVRGYAVFAAPE